jgi:hypothetical protein
MRWNVQLESSPTSASSRKSLATFACLPTGPWQTQLQNSTDCAEKLRRRQKNSSAFLFCAIALGAVTFRELEANSIYERAPLPGSTPTLAARNNFIPNSQEITMNKLCLTKLRLWPTGFVPAALILTSAIAVQGQYVRAPLVITSTNNASGNAVVVFRLNTQGTPSLELAQTLATGGKGGASTNAGIVQFEGEFGAVANYGSNTVSQLLRESDAIAIGSTIALAPECTEPDSVALTRDHLFVVGANCAESHAWPRGFVDGPVVSLSDPSAAQIAVGESWAAVTFSSGSLLQLPLTQQGGVLNGTSTPIPLPSDADMVPLGEAFWGNVLGFTPAHSPDSFAIVDQSGRVNAVAGPTPSYPVNAPCWVAKGAGNIWYTGNSPGQAISIFFSDSQGGVFYKSVPLPGSPTDITVSSDGKWLAVIYTAGGNAYVAVFSIDSYGDLTPVAKSSAGGVAAFSGVAFSD